jgi:hypothetical protein
MPLLKIGSTDVDGVSKIVDTYPVDKYVSVLEDATFKELKERSEKMTRDQLILLIQNLTLEVRDLRAENKRLAPHLTLEARLAYHEQMTAFTSED